MPPAPRPGTNSGKPPPLEMISLFWVEISKMIRLNGRLSHGSGMSMNTGGECPRGGLEEVPLGSMESFLLAT
jgi:hypothetical protein